MDFKRRATDTAIIPVEAKRPRNELVALADQQNALMQTVSFPIYKES